MIPDELLPAVEDVLECPYVLAGTVDEITGKLQRLEQRWGFTRFTVRSLEPAAQVVARL